MKNFRNTLRISKFISEGAEMSEALAKVHNAINKLARQTPVSHRGEAHKIEFLHHAVIGHEWSKDPLTRVATNQLSLKNYTENSRALCSSRRKQNLPSFETSYPTTKVSRSLSKRTQIASCTPDKFAMVVAHPKSTTAVPRPSLSEPHLTQSHSIYPP